MFVYAMSSGDYIKFGYSTDPRQRLFAIQTSSPREVSLVGYVRGTIELERQVHAFFADHRTRGEWFRKHADLQPALDAFEARSFDQLAKILGIPKEPGHTPESSKLDSQVQKNMARLGAMFSSMEAKTGGGKSSAMKENMSVDFDSIPPQPAEAPPEKEQVKRLYKKS